MNDETVFVVQGVNLSDVITKFQFDHFYHEHSCIHSILALQNLFTAHGLKILHVEHYDIHGGSFVAYVAKKSSDYEINPSVANTIKEERESGLDRLENYHEFSRRVADNVSTLKALLVDLKAQNKTVFGLGAPLKGSTLLNYGNIGPDLVQRLTEVNKFKIGRLSPGTHIPVVDEITIVDEPDYYLVLAWNFLDFFMTKKRDYLRSGGKFIVPGPIVHILDGESVAE